MIGIMYDVCHVLTDPDTKTGYATISPMRQGGERALQLEAPALHKLSLSLQNIPYGEQDDIITTTTPTLTINYTGIGGEVPRHQDGGSNTRNWLGRCVTLEGIGSFIAYRDGKVTQKITVESGDVSTHFNHAVKTQRLEHSVQNVGNKTRLSLGVLVALKAGLRGKQRTNQQAAYATVGA